MVVVNLVLLTNLHHLGSLQGVKVGLSLLQLILQHPDFVCDLAQLSFGTLSIVPPLVDLSSQLLLKLKLLLFYSLDIVLKFYLLVLVDQLSLALFFVSSPEQGFLFKILAL